MSNNPNSPAPNTVLIIPALGNIYARFADLADALLRITLGALLIPHGLQKVFGLLGGRGMAANVALFDKIGYSPGWFWGNLVAGTELIGGILLVVGLFTRPAAAAVAIFALNAIFVTAKAGGFFWSQGGAEYSILLFVVALLVLVRGAGAYSIDRAIGREF